MQIWWPTLIQEPLWHQLFSRNVYTFQLAVMCRAGNTRVAVFIPVAYSREYVNFVCSFVRQDICLEFRRSISSRTINVKVIVSRHRGSIIKVH